jgi:hypothetical protein
VGLSNINFENVKFLSIVTVDNDKEDDLIIQSSGVQGYEDLMVKIRKEDLSLKILN